MTTDLVVLAIVLIAAVGGWRRGGSRIVCRLGGLLVGALAGLRVGPWLWDRWNEPPLDRGPMIVVVVIVGALVGSAVGGVLGARIGAVLGRLHLRVPDRVAGALLRGALTLAACWIVAATVTALAPRTGAAEAIRGSDVLGEVTEAVGPPAAVLDRLTAVGIAVD